MSEENQANVQPEQADDSQMKAVPQTENENITQAEHSDESGAGETEKAVKKKPKKTVSTEPKAGAKKVIKTATHKVKFKENNNKDPNQEKINDDPNAPRINIKDLTNMSIAQLKQKADSEEAPKKSRFQQRLEEAYKIRQQQQKNQRK